MPKEQIRKRGRRKPKTEEDDQYARPQLANTEEVTVQPEPEQPQAGPSGIHPSRAALLQGRRPPPAPRQAEPAAPSGQGEQPASAPVDGAEGGEVTGWARGARTDAEIPFGVLDPDTKAYFRTVDDQIKDWEGVSSVGEEREDRQLFLQSVLSELRGHELTVSTDPDCAVVLERLLPSLGDWGRRVIGDAFGDKWEILIGHRFGSHVVQTWFTLAADTLDREARGVYPPQHTEQEKTKPSEGVLPTMTTIFHDLVTLLKPSIPSLLSNPHASPPLRLLFIVLTPGRAVPALDAGEGGNIRSKKSGKYRKNQAVQGKSVFGDEEGKGKGKAVKRTLPEDLVKQRTALFKDLMTRVGANEWKSMGINAVGAVAVQLLLEIEVEDGRADYEGSLLDIITEGMVSHLNSKESNAASEPKAQPYPALLLTTPLGSRLQETILAICPEHMFKPYWKTYFEGKVGKFAGHPFANFVVAKGISRLDVEGIEGVIRECKAVAGGRALIKTARTSALQALAERAVTLTAVQKSVVELIQSAIDLPVKEKKFFVPCLMTLKSFAAYQAIKTGTPLDENEDKIEIPSEAIDKDAEDAAAAAARLEGWKTRRNPKAKQGEDLSPNMQGCLLLQALVKIPQGNVSILDSLLAQPAETLLEYASSTIASHFLDCVLTSEAVPPKHRRRLISAFLGHYRELAQDRMGSRVADTIWAKADGFMKEKIAKSLIGDANTLASSQYGRFFASKLDLHLLDRRPDEWRKKHTGVDGKGRPAVPPKVEAPKLEKKRKEVEKDEIDDLFEGVEVKKKSKVSA